MFSKLLLLSVLGLSLILVVTPAYGFFNWPQSSKPTPKSNKSQHQLVAVQGDFVMNNVKTSGGTSSYKFYYTNEKTWKLAQQTCQNEGAVLSVVNSEQERQVLIDSLIAIKKYKKAAGFRENKSQAWIGIRKSAGDWETIYGQYLPESKLNWAKIEYTPGRVVQQPDNRKDNEDCVAVVFDNAPKLGFNDDHCLSKLPFVCEKVGKLKF